MEEIDRPFRPGRDFCLVWAVLAVPVAVWRREWFDETLPWYSQAAYLLFIPFAATLVFYGPVLLLRQVARSGRRGGQVLRSFLLVITGVACFLVLVQLEVISVDRLLLPFILGFLAVHALDWLIQRPRGHRR